jgi:hypothetical protein
VQGKPAEEFNREVDHPTEPQKMSERLEAIVATGGLNRQNSLRKTGTPLTSENGNGAKPTPSAQDVSIDLSSTSFDQTGAPSDSKSLKPEAESEREGILVVRFRSFGKQSQLVKTAEKLVGEIAMQVRLVEATLDGHHVQPVTLFGETIK